MADSGGYCGTYRLIIKNMIITLAAQAATIVPGSPTYTRKNNFSVLGE